MFQGRKGKDKAITRMPPKANPSRADPPTNGTTNSHHTTHASSSSSAGPSSSTYATSTQGAPSGASTQKDATAKKRSHTGTERKRRKDGTEGTGEGSEKKVQVSSCDTCKEGHRKVSFLCDIRLQIHYPSVFCALSLSVCSLYEKEYMQFTRGKKKNKRLTKSTNNRGVCERVCWTHCQELFFCLRDWAACCFSWPMFLCVHLQSE